MILSVSHPWCEHFYRLLSSHCDTEKGGGKGKRYRIDKQNEVSSCAAWGYLVSHGPRKERSAYQSPPPPTHSPKRIMARSWQPRPKSRMASILETVSIAAELGQQLWSCTNFRCSDRTLKSRDRIFDFWQEMVKICAGAENWAPAEILIGRASTTSQYSTGEMRP